MEIKLLKKGYQNNEQIYKDFIDDTIQEENDYFSNETVSVFQTPDFPIYMGRGKETEKREEFIVGTKIFMEAYVNTPRELHLNGNFWHAFLIQSKRTYLIGKYPQILDSFANFKTVVFKKFDWENYIYKMALAAEYITDSPLLETTEEKENFIGVIYDNLDVYNYIIKYALFRNADFVIKFLKIIDDNNWTSIMKSQIKERPDLGADERYGRRVVFELNKNFPVIMTPFLDMATLKDEMFQALRLYVTEDKIPR